MMTTSISSEALLNYKKDTWKMKTEKKKEPKENQKYKSIKKSQIFEHNFENLHLCLL